MNINFGQLDGWIERQSKTESYFSATFWFLFSTLTEDEFKATLGFKDDKQSAFLDSSASATVTVTKRTGAILQATFTILPVRRQNVYIVVSFDKPKESISPMYRLLARSRGKVQLFPFGHSFIKSSVRLSPRFSLEDTYVLRGVSYPSQPNEGGADINLKPGNALAFFNRVDEERRVLRTARFRAPTSVEATCEFTIGRLGYVSYHKGEFGPLRKLMTETLTQELSILVRPFEKARGNIVEFRFSEPLFVGHKNYGVVAQALSRLPRTSVALIHTNPYFHASLTNYEDGGEFDIFITGPSSIHVQGQGEASPASFLRIQDGLTQLFRDASVSLEKTRQYTFRELMEGQV